MYVVDNQVVHRLLYIRDDAVMGILYLCVGRYAGGLELIRLRRINWMSLSAHRTRRRIGYTCWAVMSWAPKANVVVMVPVLELLGHSAGIQAVRHDRVHCDTVKASRVHRVFGIWIG